MLSPERNQQNQPMNYARPLPSVESVDLPLNPHVTDLSLQVSRGNVTRVMSPTQITAFNGNDNGFGAGQGWIEVLTCPRCNVYCQDPVICSGCGTFGHPGCLGAEMLQGLPFCGGCFTEMLNDFSKRRDAENREEWRKAKAQQLMLWKSRATKILGVSTSVGNTIGAASASIVGSAYELAKGVTTGILETVKIENVKKNCLWKMHLRAINPWDHSARNSF